MSATNSVQMLVLYNDKRLSNALLAGTNRKQYLKTAEKSNRENSIMDICICVANAVTDPRMPIDISAKVMTGLVEIYLFNVQLLGRTLRLNEKTKIIFKRKQISEIEVHVKNKRLKPNFESLNWDNLYCLDFDNDLLTDEQIIQCLVTSENQTIVKNIADITLREAPPAITYNTLDDQDDFGPTTGNELEQFFLCDEPSMPCEQFSVDQCEPSTDIVGFEDLMVESNDRIRNAADGISIPPLDDVPMEMMPADGEGIPPLVDDFIENELNLSPNPGASAPNDSAISVKQETECLVPSMEVDSFGIGTIRSRKSNADRPKKISARCMEQSFSNYWKLQRKRPKEELQMCMTAHTAENLYLKLLRPVMLRMPHLQRFPKVKRQQHTPNRTLLMRALGLESCPYPSTICRVQAVVDPATAGPVAAVPEPTTFSVNHVPEKIVIDEPVTQPPQGNEGYISDDEMLSLLRTLWKNVSDSLPFGMVKTHITNRFTAASVFAHLLAFSAKGIIYVTKAENGSPRALVKGPNWMY